MSSAGLLEDPTIVIGVCATSLMLLQKLRQHAYCCTDISDDILLQLLIFIFTNAFERWDEVRQVLWSCSIGMLGVPQPKQIIDGRDAVQEMCILWAFCTMKGTEATTFFQAQLFHGERAGVTCWSHPHYEVSQGFGIDATVVTDRFHDN